MVASTTHSQNIPHAMDEIWNKRREHLERSVRVAALELFGHMNGGAGFECDLGNGLKLAIGPDASMSPAKDSVMPIPPAPDPEGCQQ